MPVDVCRLHDEYSDCLKWEDSILLHARMQQPSEAEYPRCSRDTVYNASAGDSNRGNDRSTTYQGIEIGGDSRAHFGDSHQQNQGLVISMSLGSPIVEAAELIAVNRCQRHRDQRPYPSKANQARHTLTPYTKDFWTVFGTGPAD